MNSVQSWLDLLPIVHRDDFIFLLYRILAAVYVDGGYADSLEEVPGLVVKGELNRVHSQWGCWFHLRGPDIYAVASKIPHPVFKNLLGDKAYAHTRMVEKLGIGFESVDVHRLDHGATTKTFESLAMQLNQSTTIGQWWFTWFEAIPLFLARAYGHKPRVSDVEAYISFRTLYLEAFIDKTYPFFKMLNGTPSYGLRVGSTFSCIEGSFIKDDYLPAFQGCPFFTLESNGLRGTGVQDIGIRSYSSVLTERIFNIGSAYCLLHSTTTIPTDVLLEQLNVQAQEDTTLPDIFA